MTLGCISIKLRVPGTKVYFVLFQVSVKRTNHSSPQALHPRTLSLNGTGNDHTKIQKCQWHLWPASLRRPWNCQYLVFPPLWKKDVWWAEKENSPRSLFTSQKGQSVSLPLTTRQERQWKRKSTQASVPPLEVSTLTAVCLLLFFQPDISGSFHEELQSQSESLFQKPIGDRYASMSTFDTPLAGPIPRPA